jgi:tetratricopeptide (TPR) repeat protein
MFPFSLVVWQIRKPNDPISEKRNEITEETVGDQPNVPHQIPSPPEDFTGREEEISALMEGFDRGATITGLRGMGGIGKTALAMVLAERLKSRFPDGQIFIDLRGTSDKPLTSAEAMAHIIRAYHPEVKIPEDENGLRGLYNATLANKKALLLLDNASSRDQVESLLPPDGCALLITSRNKFAVPGLVEKDLDVLPQEDAKELLMQIAARIGDRAGDLARLCGYLPIALRNAASALAEKKDLDVAEYLKRLEDARNRVELVEASFSLSYDNLPPYLRSLWKMLSVFPADFDRVGVAAVWGQDLEETAKALGDLLKWSLLDFNPEGKRYRLHDLARDFAFYRLDNDSKAEVQQRHAEYYSKVLSSANEIYKQGGDSVLAGLKLFDLEKANIMAGHAWAKKNMQENSTAAHLCNSYPDAGVYVLDLRLHPSQKISWLEVGLEAARRSKDEAAEGVHLGNLGQAYAALGETRKAIEYYDQALMISRKIGDRRGEGARLGNLGLAYADLGETRKAIGYHDQALKISQETEDRRGEGNRLGNLGLAYADLGETRKATEYYDQALKISQEIGDRRGEGNHLGNLGNAYAALGETRKATGYYDQALKISQDIGDRRGEENHLGNLGQAYAALGETKKAIEYYNRALGIACEIGDRRNEGAWLMSLSLAYDKLGDIRRAIEYHDQAQAIKHEIQERRIEA